MRSCQPVADIEQLSIMIASSKEVRLVVIVLFVNFFSLLLMIPNLENC